MARIDREALLETTDLAALVEAELGPPARRSGPRWLFWCCPFHTERTASFGVTRDNGRWKCFGSCGETGNAIDFMMKRHNVDFRGACRMLGVMDLPEPGRPVKAQRLLANHEPPGELWQTRGWAFIDYAKRTLWGSEGRAAFEYLRYRGLADATIQAFELGYNPRAVYDNAGKWGVPEAKKVYLSKGIVIPCSIEHELWYIQVRRPAVRKDGSVDMLSVHLDGTLASFLPDRKYWAAKGSNLQALFGLDQVQAEPGELPSMLEEGEFNGMVVWQEAGDLVTVVSTGSASVRPESLWPWREWFLMTDTVFVRFDPDAVKRAEDFNRALSRRCRRVQVPEGDDTNEFHQRGGSVRDWIAFELEKVKYTREGGR